jgi:hypothetical protein
MAVTDTIIKAADSAARDPIMFLSPTTVNAV